MPRAEPGRGLEVLRQLQDLVGLLDEVPDVIHQLGSEQFETLTQLVLRTHTRSGQVATVMTADAVERGALRNSTAANAAQWVIGQATAADVAVEPAEARAIATVAMACRDRKNRVITEAVAHGGCSVSTARAALTQADKIAPVIPTADRDEILSWFLQLDPATGSRGADAFTRRLLAIFDGERLSQDDAKLERVESLTWGTTATGMTRVIAELSPANSAILKAAVNAGSAPATTTVEDEAGAAERVLDERTPGKRRADALMELVSAGARATTHDSASLGSAATVLMTMDLAALTAGIGGATTPVGDVLDAGAARRAACDADVIPVVLGGPSQPLDVGRRERLVAKGLRAAVVIRDQGCTFPGCDRPPGFCEVHHVVPWWAGGETKLGNSAMLCCRHHQVVHRHGYTATVTESGVAWELTPGRMPGHTPA